MGAWECAAWDDDSMGCGQCGGSIRGSMGCAMGTVHAPHAPSCCMLPPMLPPMIPSMLCLPKLSLHILCLTSSLTCDMVSVLIACGTCVLILIKTTTLNDHVNLPCNDSREIVPIFVPVQWYLGSGARARRGLGTGGGQDQE